MKALYVDLDGTLLGPGGAIVKGADGSFSLDALRAVEACTAAGAEVVLMTARGRTTCAEIARLLGQGSYIYEAGSCVVIDGEEEWLTGEYQPGSLSIHDQIEDAGAAALLLSHYAGRLEYHEPWHRNRDVSHLFRGLVDAFEVDELLAEHGHAGLRLIDNGAVHRRSEALAALPQVRAYHLLPRGASKAGGVEWHMRARGYDPSDCLAAGDSREDLSVAAVVGSFWLVANALTKDPTIAEALGEHANVTVASAGYGAGVLEAVSATLAG